MKIAWSTIIVMLNSGQKQSDICSMQPRPHHNFNVLLSFQSEQTRWVTLEVDTLDVKLRRTIKKRETSKCCNGDWQHHNHFLGTPSIKHVLKEISLTNNSKTLHEHEFELEKFLLSENYAT